MKTDRALVILVIIVNLIVLTIVAILIYWCLQLNELRMVQAIDQIKINEASIEKLKETSKVVNRNGNITVLGSFEVK